MHSDSRSSYWRKGQGAQNIGDFLSEFLFIHLSRKSPSDWFAGAPAGEHDVIHLLGSVIADAPIARALEHARAGGGRPVAFWGCGKRDEQPVAPGLLARCDILGARGPLTRDALGLPPETPLGDPGLLLPLLHEPHSVPGLAGAAICVPHFFEKRPDAELLDLTGADRVVRPNIAPRVAELTRLIDAIAGAGFVLAGALHAAVVACAYGVPFAFFDSGYVNLPFKWQDFAGSVGIPCRFVGTVADGVACHEAVLRPALRRPRLAPLLEVAPLHAPRELLARAHAQDAHVAAG